MYGTACTHQKCAYGSKNGDVASLVPKVVPTGYPLPPPPPWNFCNFCFFKLAVPDSLMLASQVIHNLKKKEKKRKERRKKGLKDKHKQQDFSLKGIPSTTTRSAWISARTSLPVVASSDLIASIPEAPAHILL